jgi:hypothetical protein
MDNTQNASNEPQLITVEYNCAFKGAMGKVVWCRIIITQRYVPILGGGHYKVAAFDDDHNLVYAASSTGGAPQTKLTLDEGCELLDDIEHYLEMALIY